MNLVNTILPPSGELPGAVKVNVHVFIDKFIKEVTSVDDKPIHRSTVEKSMQALLAMSGEEKIEEVDNEAYIQFLNTYLKNWEGDEEVNQFLAQMRSMAIWSYKISEQVGENVMVYKPVPGEQKGCVDLQEATGGKAWSL